MADSASRTCTENIALFHLLHAGRGKDGVLSKDSVPARPSITTVEWLPRHREDYVLSFERERSLAGALAYISNTKDDPNRVPAICVEEDHHEGYTALRILLAMNKSECKDGEDLLRTIKEGFEGIFKALSKVADSCKLLRASRDLGSATERYGIRTDDAQVGVEHEIRRLIISMCSEKILTRLNLRRRKNRSPNQPAKEKLQDFIRALAPHGAMKLPPLASVSDGERALIVERARKIIPLIDAWKNHPKLQQLESLVCGFYQLRKLDCQAVVNAIPEEEMNKSSKKSLMNMILKVARYAEAARFLFRTAKKFPIARCMQVILISLPEKAFLRTPVKSEYKLSLSSILPRIIGLRKTKLTGQEYEPDTVRSLLDTTWTRADDELTAQACRTLTTGKLHAEVQIIFHYEMLKSSNSLEQDLLPPRIVCSSKKACFLCNLLISMHDNLRTPWCHGKLYPGWRLPQSSGLDLQSRFNKLLEDTIRDSIVLLFKRRKKTTYPGPNESTLITLTSLESEVEGALGPTHDEQVSSDGTEAEDSGEDVQTANGVMDCNGGPITSLDSLLPSEELESVTGKLSSEASQAAESSSDSQHESSLCSSNAQLIAEEDMEWTEHAAKAQASYEETEKEAQAGPSASPSKDHVDCIKPDPSVPGSLHCPEIGQDHIKSHDVEGQTSQSPTHCQEGFDSVDDDSHLQRGQKQFHTIHPKQTSPFYTTRSLEVQLEYSTGPSLQTAAGKHANELSFSIERLSVDEIVRLKDHGTAPVVDAEAMLEDTPEIPLVMPKSGHLYISSKEDVLKITFHSRTDSSITSRQR